MSGKKILAQRLGYFVQQFAVNERAFEVFAKITLVAVDFLCQPGY